MGKLVIATHKELTEMVTSLRAENEKLRAALEHASIGGNHVALIIGADHPPDTTTHDIARKHYGARHIEYEAWCCWKAIRAAAAALKETE